MIYYLDNLASFKSYLEKLNMIKQINNFRINMDIYNGEKYMSNVINNPEIYKHLKIRSEQENVDINGQRISKEISFVYDCYAVIDAIAKSIIEDKIKDEYKNQLSSNIKDLNEWVEL